MTSVTLNCSFGATLGDVLTTIPEKGGIGLGTVNSSLVFAVVLVIGIIFLR